MIFDIKKSNRLKGEKGLDLAKKILQRDRTQKIILVTTSMKEQLPKDKLQSATVNEKEILVMPFHFLDYPNCW